MLKNRTFITGTDSSQFDILCWFIEQFHKNSKENLIVYDFGLDEYNAIGLGAKKLVSTMGLTGWFLKPVAIYDTLDKYHNVVWLDTDIEITENIDNIFNLIEDSKILLADDAYMQIQTGTNIKNTGIVGINSTAVMELIIPWIRACQTGQKRGDQEALNLLLKSKLYNKDKVTDLSEYYHGQRLNPKCYSEKMMYKTMHWTGPIGKEIIRKRKILKENHYGA